MLRNWKKFVAVDDTPQDGKTARAVSSNWAYNHNADIDAHVSGATAGQLLVATGATTAVWKSTGVKLSAPDISGIVTAASALTMPAFTAGGDIIGQATYDLGSAASPFAEAYIGNTNDYLLVKVADNLATLYGMGGYLRIGDAGTTAHSLNSEDDLMVTGELEVKGKTYLDGQVELKATVTMMDAGDYFKLVDGAHYSMGSGVDVLLTFVATDVNANALNLMLPAGGATNVPVLTVTDILATDLGLFDGVTQPTIAIIEKDEKYQSSSSGTHDGIDLDELTETGAFANSVVGDIVRIISGTNVTAGWYRIKVKTDDNNVDLDRNFVTGANGQSDVVYLIYHKLGMYGAEGSCMPAKYSDFGASDFEMSAAGIFFGYNLTDNEIQVVLPDGTMKFVALT